MLKQLGDSFCVWQAQTQTNNAVLVAAAKESGFDPIFTVDAWGADAFTSLACCTHSVRWPTGSSSGSLPTTICR